MKNPEIFIIYENFFSAGGKKSYGDGDMIICPLGHEVKQVDSAALQYVLTGNCYLEKVHLKLGRKASVEFVIDGLLYVKRDGDGKFICSINGHATNEKTFYKAMGLYPEIRGEIALSFLRVKARNYSNAN